MRRLVTSWIEAERASGNTTAAALRQLNQALGTQTTHSRLAEWRRGVYVPSQTVISYMLNQTLRWAMARAGITFTGSQFGALEDLIWVTTEKGGDWFFEIL